MVAKKPIKSTIWMAIIWAVVALLGGIQYVALLTHHDQIQETTSLTMVLIAFFLGFPVTVITLAEWLNYGLPKNIKFVGTYVFYLLILYGFFALLDIILPKHVAFFEIKMLLVLHLVALGWVSVFGIANLSVRLCDKALVKLTGNNINGYVGMVLGAFMGYLTYQAIRYGVEHTNFVAWFLNFGN